MFPRYKIVENFFRIPLTPFPHHLARSIRQVACWKCGTENATNLYCQSCNVLQEPDSKSNYFDLLGISLSYNVQSSDLVSKYHKKQVLFHPDKHSNKSDVSTFYNFNISPQLTLTTSFSTERERDIRKLLHLDQQSLHNSLESFTTRFIHVENKRIADRRRKGSYR